MQKAMKFNDVAIAFVKKSDYRIHFWYMSKDNPITIMKSYYKFIIIIIIFFPV